MIPMYMLYITGVRVEFGAPFMNICARTASGTSDCGVCIVPALPYHCNNARLWTASVDVPLACISN
jgi:hypothetical protein